MIPTVLVLAFLGGLLVPRRVARVVAVVTVFWMVLLVVDGAPTDTSDLLGGAALGAVNAAVGAAMAWAIQVGDSLPPQVLSIAHTLPPMTAEPRTPLRTRLRRGAVRMLNSVTRRFGHEMVPVESRRSLIRQVDSIYRTTLHPNLLAPDAVRLELLGGLTGTSASEALHIVACLKKSLGSEGDVCEFGVAQGDTSALLAHEILSTDRLLWLFDTFHGLPRPHAKDQLKDDILGLGSIEAYEGKMAYGVADVRRQVAAVGFPRDRVRVLPGLIEAVLEDAALAKPGAVCFAYIDFDFYSGIHTALDFLHGRLSPGAHVVVDDYDFFSTGAKLAVDEFVAAHPHDYSFSVAPEELGGFCTFERIR